MDMSGKRKEIEMNKKKKKYWTDIPDRPKYLGILSICEKK